MNGKNRIIFFWNAFASEEMATVVNEHMLGVGMKPKVSNAGYEKAAALKTVQDQAVELCVFWCSLCFQESN